MKTNNKNRYLMVLGLSIFGVVSDVSAGRVKNSKAMAALDRKAKKIARELEIKKEKEERDYKENLRLANEEYENKLIELQNQRKAAVALMKEREEEQKKRFDNAKKPIKAQEAQKISDLAKQKEQVARNLYDQMQKKLGKIEANAGALEDKPQHQRYRELLYYKASEIQNKAQQLEFCRRKLEFYPPALINFSKEDETEEVSSWFGLRKRVQLTPEAAKIKDYKNLLGQIENLQAESTLLKEEFKVIEEENKFYIQHEMYKPVQEILDAGNAQLRNIDAEKIPVAKQKAQQQIEKIDPRSWYEKIIGEEILIDTKEELKEESLFDRFKNWLSGSDKEVVQESVIHKQSDVKYDDLIDPEKALIDRVMHDHPDVRKNLALAMMAYKETLHDKEKDTQLGEVEKQSAQVANASVSKVSKPVVSSQKINAQHAEPLQKDSNVVLPSSDPVVPAVLNGAQKAVPSKAVKGIFVDPEKVENILCALEANNSEDQTVIGQKNPKNDQVSKAMVADGFKELNEKVDATTVALKSQAEALKTLAQNTENSLDRNSLESNNNLAKIQEDINKKFERIQEDISTLKVAADIAKAMPQDSSASQAAEKIVDDVAKKHDVVIPQEPSVRDIVLENNIAREVEGLLKQTDNVSVADIANPVNPEFVEYSGPEFQAQDHVHEQPQIDLKIEEKQIKNNPANITGSWPSGVSKVIGLVSDHPYATAGVALGVVSAGCCYWMYKKRCAAQAERVAMQERFAALNAQVRGHNQRLDDVEARLDRLNPRQ